MSTRSWTRRPMQAISLLLLLAMADSQPLSTAAQTTPATTPGVALKLVTYDELGDVVRQHKGKIIIVDFWSTT